MTIKPAIDIMLFENIDIPRIWMFVHTYRHRHRFAEDFQVGFNICIVHGRGFRVEEFTILAKPGDKMSPAPVPRIIWRGYVAVPKVDIILSESVF